MKIIVNELPEFECAFRQNNQGWLGSDVAFSMPLAANKVLWLFGDTFISPLNKGAIRQNAKIIRNSIGIQTGHLKSQNSIKFYWRNENNKAASFFINGEEQGFIWPLCSILISGKLFVFALRVIHPDHTNVFGFRLIGNDLIMVENPLQDPSEWYYQIKNIPVDKKRNYWGSSIFKENNFLYIYGFQKEKPGWPAEIKMIIARLNLLDSHNLSHFSKWEFFNKNNKSWTKDWHDIKPVLLNRNTEYSLSYMQSINKYVLVGYQVEKNRINLRLSGTPNGPFSKPKVIYNCPENLWNSNYFCYAAKAHPELSNSDDELIISYASNSKVLQSCLEDNRIYFPRFLRIKFS